MKARARSIAFLVLVAAACDKKQDAPPPLPTAAAAPATTAAPAATPSTTLAAPIESNAVQTEEDFEDDAERGITPENLEAELDKLEREIGQ